MLKEYLVFEKPKEIFRNKASSAYVARTRFRELHPEAGEVMIVPVKSMYTHIPGKTQKREL